MPMTRPKDQILEISATQLHAMDKAVLGRLGGIGQHDPGGQPTIIGQLLLVSTLAQMISAGLVVKYVGDKCMSHPLSS